MFLQIDLWRSQGMKTVLHKNQYYIVSTLKRYREIAKQEMLSTQQSKRQLEKYIVARQKNKIYATLISMVIHEGISDTIEYALRLYAKLPLNPVKSKETIQACERALEAFFLLTKVSPHLLQDATKQRSSLVEVIKSPQQAHQLANQLMNNLPQPSVTLPTLATNPAAKLDTTNAHPVELVADLACELVQEAVSAQDPRSDNPP